MAELNPENIKRTNEELDKTVEKLSKASGVREKDVRTLLQQKELLKAINQEEKDRVERTEELYGVEGDLTKDLKEQLSTTRKLKKEVRDLQRSWEDQLEEIPETFKKLQGLISVTSRKVVNEFERQAAEATKAINVIQRGGGEVNPVMLFSEKDKKATAKRVKEIADEIDKIDDRAIGKGLLAKMKASEAGFSDIKKGWQDGDGKGWRVQGEMLKQKGGLLQAAGKGKAAGAMGGAMKGAGALLAGASKLVPVVSGVVAGLSKLNDMVNSADRLVKGARADYQKIAGAQFAGGEFSRLSKEYNVEIRDIARNVSLGVDHNEWNAMFSSMANAGMTLEATGSKLGYMGDVMETVRRSSLTLGTTMDITGEIFAEQSQEMRSGLATIQEGMLEVAKGAKYAGMETNKFYQHVLQSTMAMATYGNFTGEAANAVKKMGKSAGLTQEEGSKLGADMASWTANMTHIQGVNLGSQMLAKGVNYEDYRKEELATQKKKLEGATTEEEKDRYKVNIEHLESLKNKKDQASAMSQILKIKGAEDAPKLLLEQLALISGGHKSILDAFEADSLSYQDYSGLNISNDLVQQIQRALFSVTTEAKKPFEQMNKALEKASELEGGEKKKEIEALKEAAEILQKGANATEAEQKKALGILKEKGVTSSGLNDLVEGDAEALGNRLSSAISAVEEGREGTMGDLKTYADEIIKRSTKKGTGFEPVVEGQDDMIEALTPLEKMTQIAKDSVVYSLSDSKAMQTMVGLSAQIRTGVTGILDHLLGKTEGAKAVEGMGEAEAAVADARTLQSEQKALLEKEDLTQADVKAFIQKTLDTVNESGLDKDLKKRAHERVSAGGMAAHNAKKLGPKESLLAFLEEYKEGFALAARDNATRVVGRGEEYLNDSEISANYKSAIMDKQEGLRIDAQRMVGETQESFKLFKGASDQREKAVVGNANSTQGVPTQGTGTLEVKIDSTINSNGSSTVKSKATLEGKNSREGTH